jgi:hypothetical protein
MHRRRSRIVVLLRDLLCAVGCADIFKYAAYHKRKTNFGRKESRAKTICREANVTG